MYTIDEIRDKAIEKFLDGDLIINYAEYRRYYKIIAVSNSGKTLKVKSSLGSPNFDNVKTTSRSINWVYDRINKCSIVRDSRGKGQDFMRDNNVTSILDML